MSCLINESGFDRRGAARLFCAAVVMLSGCKRDDGLPECAPVSGKVTIGDEPLASAMVTFHPAGEGNRGQSATDVDGTYTLTTYGTEDGAIVGQHSVTVERHIPPMPSQPGGKLPSAKSVVPPKYHVPSSSPLKFEVKSGTNNVFDIRIEK